MAFHYSRRSFLFFLFASALAVTACQSNASPGGRLVIGVVSYNQGEQMIDRYAEFNRYLAEKLNVHVEMEPTFNETKAIERIESQAWSLVFASPGVAAIAIANHQYLPLFPLQDIINQRSALVVRDDSPIVDMSQLEGKTVALGQNGSATGYYFPLYNLYGLTLAEILFAPTPQTVMEWVAQGQAAAGALSVEELNRYQAQYDQPKLRILAVDSHQVPPGGVLVGPTVERVYQEQIRKIMDAASPELAQAVGYVPNATPPNYDYMISVVERVRSIATQIYEKPVRLY